MGMPTLNQLNLQEQGFLLIDDGYFFMPPAGSGASQGLISPVSHAFASAGPQGLAVLLFLFSIFHTNMKPNHITLPLLFNLLAFVLASLLGAAAAFAQPACDPGFADDGDSIAAATDVDDDNDGLIEICDLNGLDHVRYNLAGTSYKASSSATANTTGCPTAGCKGYELTKDLDFTVSTATGYNEVWTADDPAAGKGWPPIGGRLGFEGEFEGNGHVIKNLHINNGTDTGQNIGFFSIIFRDAKVRNLGLTGASMRVTGATNIGSLAGENSGTVDNCYSTGSVTAAGGIYLADNVGGLLGINNGLLVNSYATGDVTATIKRAGGLVGWSAGGSVSNCYATGQVTGMGDQIGGLMGISIAVSNCYATGQVTATGNTRGSLIGWLTDRASTVSNCYATGNVTSGGMDIGGLVGKISGTISDSYWESSDAATSSDTRDRTSTQLKSLPIADATDLFDAWSTDDWHFGLNSQYPALKSKDLDGDGVRIEGYVLCGQPGQADATPLRAACSSVISVEAAADGIEEGFPAVFVITRRGNDPDTAAVDVTVALSFTESFMEASGTPTSVTLPAGPWAEAAFEVAILDDDVDEVDGTVTATISIPAGAGRKVASAPHNSATVAVADDDLPLVSIAGGASVVEGEGAVFTVTREGVTTEALPVKVTVDGGAGFLPSPVSVEVGGSAVSPITGEADSFMIMIAAGATEVDFTAASEGDGLDEADGMIEATVTAVDGSYRVDTADPPVSTTVSASVDVTDNDLPLVSIAGGASVIEGEGAVFTVTRVGDTTGALSVKVTVGGGAGFLPSPVSVEVDGSAVSPIAGEAGSFVVMIAAGATEVDFTAASEGDGLDEADGMIEATVTAVDGSYRVDVADPPVSTTVSASVDVTDNDLPLVSIAGGASVVEGGGAVFTVSREGLTAEVLPVKVTVGGGAGFLPSPVTVMVDGTVVDSIVGEAGSFLVMIGIAATEVDFTAASEGDGLDEADGMIEATVTAVDGSYRVDAADTPVATTVSASVDVTDNDLPSITSFEIGGNSGRIDEDADPKTITVTVAEGTSLADLRPTVVTVRSNATVAPSGAVTFVDGTAQPYTVTAGGDTVTYQVTVNVVVGTPPGVPGGFSAVAGVEQVTLSWTAPTELGSTGTLSRYEYRQTQGVDVSPWKAVEPLTALTQVVGSLMAGEVYGFEVRAVGSNELAGDATAKQEATPLAVGAPMFTDTIADQTYTKDTVILNLVLPEATGGTGALTYSLSPTLPADLEFDADTRTLSGTPTAEKDETEYTYTVTDSATSPLTADLTFTIAVSEEAPTLDAGVGATLVHVYPNPAGDVLHIEFPGTGEYGIALLTLTGQPVLGERHAGGGTRILDLSSLKGGVYFLKIEDSEGISHTFRIIR